MKPTIATIMFYLQLIVYTACTKFNQNPYAYLIGATLA
jgi:hypothetical protein